MRSPSWWVDSQVVPYLTSSFAFSAKAAIPASISAREGRSYARSIRLGTSAFNSGSSASRLLWSYHSYSRVVRSTGASGFVHVIRRWKIGKRWNMPPGASSRESTACEIPSRRSQ
jgi:hypothetical protein